MGERSGLLKKALDVYKFERVQAAGSTFSQLLDITIPILPRDIVVTAIPTSPHNVRVRGYDHAQVMAKRLARHRSLPFRPLLERSGTQTQHFAGRAERKYLASTAFEARGKAKRVLLIDDIVTTGFTLSAAVEQLKAAGCEEIYVAVVARQPSRREP